jgi:uncharacterized protein YjgD (DUF1641 family)
MLPANSPNPRLCQSCIERGINPPGFGEREYLPNRYLCNECMKAELDKLIGIPQAEVTQNIKKVEAGPILTEVYRLLNIPPELQFDSIDATCYHQLDLYNFHAPANVNLTLKELESKIEEMAICMYQFQQVVEPTKKYIDDLKKKRRLEKGLSEYPENVEKFAKVKKKITEPAAKEKIEKTIKKSLSRMSPNGEANLGSMDDLVKQAIEMQQKQRTRQFHIMSGNCPACGGKYPCAKHPNEKLT